MNDTETAALLADSAYLKFIMSFHIIVSSLAIAAVMHMLWNRSTMKIVAHKSLLLLMDFHTFWTLAVGVAMFVNESITMHAHLTMRDPSDLLVAAPICLIRRAPLLLSCLGSIFSQLAMAAERYRASSNLASYEKSSSSTGHLLNAAHLAATFLIGAAHMSVYGTEWVRPHCTVVTPEGGSVHTNLTLVTIISEVTTIVTFKRLLSKNSRLHDDPDSGLTLSERYQLSENIRMLKLLLPIIWSHTILGLVGCALFVAGLIAFPSSELYPLVEESTCTLYLQGILMPLIFFYRYRQEERKVQQQRSVNSTRGAAMASHHAKVIMERW